MVKIQKNNKTIIFCYDDGSRSIICKRKASTFLSCAECDNVFNELPEKSISKKDVYVRIKRRYFEGRGKVRNVCLKCWKGNLPLEFATNRDLKVLNA